MCEKNNLSDGIQCCHLHCFIPHESSAVIDVQHPTILFIKTLYNRQVGHNKLESSNSKRPNPTGGRLILGLLNNVASTTETV